MSEMRITDKERLDWLEANVVEIIHVLPEVGAGWVREEGWRIRLSEYHYIKKPTLRESIDSAIKTIEAEKG